MESHLGMYNATCSGLSSVIRAATFLQPSTADVLRSCITASGTLYPSNPLRRLKELSMAEVIEGYEVQAGTRRGSYPGARAGTASA